MMTNRREFLTTVGKAGLGGAGALLNPMITSLANAEANTEYRALVCFFLYGGNDSNNMVIPIDSLYNTYASGREGLAIAQNQLLSLTSTQGNSIGLHPAMADIKTLWDAGKAQVVLNSGTLVKPVAKSDYNYYNPNFPSNLFSHNDQQHQSQTATYREPSRKGWAGQSIDQLSSNNAGALLPSSIGVGVNDVFILNSNNNISLPAYGRFDYSDYDGDAKAGNYSTMRRNAYRQIVDNATYTNQLVQGVQQAKALSQNAKDTLANIFNTNNTPVDSIFSTIGGNYYYQMVKTVAKIMQARTTLRSNRQVFMIPIGGFDTHVDQLTYQGTLLTYVSHAMKLLHDAADVMGLTNQVISFTASDFNRTFKPNATNGTDHAWAGHQILAGAALKDKTIHGQFTNMVLGGSDDLDGYGRWIPRVGLDQVFAPLAEWLGVPNQQLNTIFPYLSSQGAKLSLF